MLILAVEPDRRQASQLVDVVFPRLKAEAVIAASAERALASLGDRVPDLILTSALLSPKDETALADRLRALDGAASYVQTLTIPVLAATRPKKPRRGVLAKLRRQEGRATPDGCDPVVFAEQCVTYLERARSERAVPEPDAPNQPAPANAMPPVVATLVHEEPVAAEALVEESAWEEPVLQEVPRLTAEPVLVGPVLVEPVLVEPVLVEPVLVEPLLVEPLLVESFLADLVPETSALEAEAVEDVWAPLPTDSSRFWPPVEGEPAENRAVVIWLELEPAWPVEPVAIEPEPLFAVDTLPQPEPVVDPVVELVVEPVVEPVVERVDERVVEAAAALASTGQEAPVALASPVAEPPSQGPGEPLRGSPEQPASGGRDASPAPAPARRPNSKREAKPKPIQDEWGLFDPEQCGFAALLRKLEEITNVA